MKSAIKANQTFENIPAHACGWLEVDLPTVSRNFHTLQSHLPSASCGAVVKANAYGLGLIPISKQLFHEGCQKFFVAHLEEALPLRKALPAADIFVLTGCLPGSEREFLEHNLTPVINDFGMLERWVTFGKETGHTLDAMLHVDTGMQRIGFDPQDLKKLKASMGILAGIKLQGIMSHLACSPDPNHPHNEAQRILFDEICQDFPHISRSLADTAGIYLGETYHYDLVRPGKGLFGLFQAPKGPALEQAFTLKGRIIQIRQAKKGESVGYGAQGTLTQDTVLATLGLGYADGLDRRLSQGGTVLIGGFKAPVLGSLSMDYTVIDVTHIPSSLYYVGGWAQITGPNQPLEKLAAELGTISRELSSRLGSRLFRS